MLSFVVVGLATANIKKKPSQTVRLKGKKSQQILTKQFVLHESAPATAVQRAWILTGNGQ